MEECDLREADRIVRLAFGTFIGVPDPETFMGDAESVRTRWRADPRGAFVAELDGEIVGSNMATKWGSVAFFGPLTVRPDLWDRGIGKKLMEPIVEVFDEWKVAHCGLYTFSDSPKHLGLYQHFGFWPGYLCAMMEKPIGEAGSAERVRRFSELTEDEREACLHECAAITGAIYPGLNVRFEIEAVSRQNLGDTVLLRNDGKLAGFAVCHTGPGTEAGSGMCYVKFAAARSGPDARARFAELLKACERYAFESGAATISGGVSTGRRVAYVAMLDYGFRSRSLGVTMHRNGEPAYNRPDVFVIDDWR